MWGFYVRNSGEEEIFIRLFVNKQSCEYQSWYTYLSVPHFALPTGDVILNQMQTFKCMSGVWKEDETVTYIGRRIRNKINVFHKIGKISDWIANEPETGSGCTDECLVSMDRKS